MYGFINHHVVGWRNLFSFPYQIRHEKKSTASTKDALVSLYIQGL